MKTKIFTINILIIVLMILATHLTGCGSTEKVVSSNDVSETVLRPLIEGSVRQARVQGADTTFSNMRDVQIELRAYDDFLLASTRTDAGGLFRISSPDLIEDESYNLVARAVGMTTRIDYTHNIESFNNLQIVLGDVSYVVVQDRRLEIEVIHTGNPASVRPGN